MLTCRRQPPCRLLFHYAFTPPPAGVTMPYLRRRYAIRHIVATLRCRHADTISILPRAADVYSVADMPYVIAADMTSLDNRDIYGCRRCR